MKKWIQEYWNENSIYGIADMIENIKNSREQDKMMANSRIEIA